jgi:hypothetical protein
MHMFKYCETHPMTPTPLMPPVPLVPPMSFMSFMSLLSLMLPTPLCRSLTRCLTWGAHAWRAARLRSPLLVASAAAVLLVGCAQTPAPQWQGTAAQSWQRGVQAYLVGMGQVARAEFERSRSALGSTANLEAVANLELLQCAARTASLEAGKCSPSIDASYMSAAQLAYVNYLNGALPSAAEQGLLPAAQQRLVNALKTGGNVDAVVREVQASNEQPLSALLMCAIALDHKAANLSVVGQAVDLASQQGWRRPLLSWLTVQQNMAAAQGNTALAQSSQQRIDVLLSTADLR